MFYRWLRMEHQLLTLDAQIKSNLGLDSADVDECMQAMDEILNLPIDPLMLKKHSHIVETVRQVIFSKYSFYLEVFFIPQ